MNSERENPSWYWTLFWGTRCSSNSALLLSWQLVGGPSGALRSFVANQVHVSHPDGEAKFCLEPTIELARNVGLSPSRINEAERLVQSHQQEITYAWNTHFCS
jgi:hypothetical protein